MAGNANSGYKKPTTESRVRLDPSDKPDRPANLAGHAAEYWASTIAPCPHLLRIDTPLAEECCRQYELYRRAVVACESIPLDDEAATTAAKYFNLWQVCVRKLGLDPVSRTKLAMHFYREAKKDDAPALSYFGGKKTG